MGLGPRGPDQGEEHRDVDQDRGGLGSEAPKGPESRVVPWLRIFLNCFYKHQNPQAALNLGVVSWTLRTCFKLLLIKQQNSQAALNLGVLPWTLRFVPLRFGGGGGGGGGGALLKRALR